MSNIEWTEATWNPIVGCSVVSPGCTNCYAMTMAARLEAMGTLPQYAGTTQKTKGGPVWTGKVALASQATLTQPLRWKRPRRIFVNSMGDLFHEDVPDAWIDRVFAVMALSPQHTYQILTKRSARMRAYLEVLSANAARDAANDLPARWQIRLSEANPPGSLAISKADVQRALGLGAKMSIDPPTPSWPLPNVWLGVSAEDQRRADERIPDLLATSAAIRFVSAEPLLGPVDFAALSWAENKHDRRDWFVDALRGRFCSDAGDGGPFGSKLDWVIVGGESGANARPMHPDWARAIRDQCADAGTAFFFKQWGEWKHGSDFAGDAMAVLSDGIVSEPTPDALQKLDRVESVPRRHPTMMRKVGKARAGRILDGATHDAMPELRHG